MLGWSNLLKRKILVIDDMPVFREPIAATLRMQGFDVSCAGDGQEGLDIARQENPDLILLDMSMPVMDGLGFLKHRQDDDQLNQIPVILLSAISDEDYISQANDYGISHHLLKSRFSSDELIQTIESCLGELAEP